MHTEVHYPCGCRIEYRRWHDDEPLRISDDYYAIVACEAHHNAELESRMFGSLWRSQVEAEENIAGKLEGHTGRAASTTSNREEQP